VVRLIGTLPRSRKKETLTVCCGCWRLVSAVVVVVPSLELERINEINDLSHAWICGVYSRLFV
jgi:hypothetical protein